MPPEAAIGWILALYRPGGRQGHRKNDDEKATSFAGGHFEGNDRCTAPVRYRAHPLMEEVQVVTNRCRGVVLWVYGTTPHKYHRF